VTIVRVGTNKKYADGWETAFGKGKSATAGKSSGKATAKKSAKKKTAKGKR
jgi:hypothetical protein